MIAAHLEVAFVACWVIIADTSGYRNHFISFLSHDRFVRYSKRSYAIYLVSPIITLLVYGLCSQEGSLNIPEIVSKKIACSIFLQEMTKFYFVCISLRSSCATQLINSPAGFPLSSHYISMFHFAIFHDIRCQRCNHMRKRNKAQGERLVCKRVFIKKLYN
jgi:hypothetical protein